MTGIRLLWPLPALLSWALGWALFALLRSVGAPLAVAIAGAVALGVASAADTATAQNKSLTYSDAARAADAANGKAIGADILYGVGGAAAAAGVLMFVFSMPEPGMKAGAAP